MASLSIWHWLITLAVAVLPLLILYPLVRALIRWLNRH